MKKVCAGKWKKTKMQAADAEGRRRKTAAVKDKDR
jgi:hypothetical protein